jgi:hypothetical protein
VDFLTNMYRDEQPLSYSKRKQYKKKPLPVVMLTSNGLKKIVTL